MPVGTAGTVKAVHQHELKQHVEAPVILGNTYHLYLRPGTETISQAGGIHRFIGWDRPILTDSGGFQVYSLSSSRDIDEEGVTFKSHIDGSTHRFTPESAIEIQRMIGADIIMAFDECTPYPCTYKYARNSMELTHRWLDRCVDYALKSEPKYGYDQILSPIVQGSTYPDLRKKSGEYIAGVDSEIYAIGGLSVGEPAEDMYAMTQLVCSILPTAKARYLMGVGKPENVLECIERGIDMFDCVLPTRNARHGKIYTTQGIIHIKNAKWERDFSPIDPELPLPSGDDYSIAYLRHLFMAKEILALQIASLQNLLFYQWLTREARKMIIKNTFGKWKNELLPVITRKR